MPPSKGKLDYFISGSSLVLSLLYFVVVLDVVVVAGVVGVVGVVVVVVVVDDSDIFF